MTLEITITDTVDVTDLVGRVLNFAAKLLSWLKPADESADTPDVDDPEDNKSPPLTVTDTVANSKLEAWSMVQARIATDSDRGGSFRP